MDLGATIRARRLELGLTLERLAGRTGVSRAMLSDIERGAKNPTVKLAAQIAKGLGWTISQLLGEPTPEAPDPVSLVRLSEQHVLIDPRSGIERHLLSPAFQRRGIEVLWYVVPPGPSTGPLPPLRSGAEAHVTVIQGRLHWRLGDREETLSIGDSLSFPADRGYELENPDPTPSQYFVVIDSTRPSAAR